jgi:WD40 repeat protein
MNGSPFEDRQPTVNVCQVTQDIPATPDASFDECPTLRGPLAGSGSAPTSAGEQGQADPRRIGDYDVLERLGQGGMGVVYRARHRRLNRLVALKVLHRVDSVTDVQRFHREAELAARLQHPHIVGVYEVGSWSEGEEMPARPWIAFELVAGGGLDRLLRESVLAPRQAAALVETLARTLHVVHGHGIVHRDLKPANVLLSGSGVASAPRGGSTPGADATGLTPKIADFGLACLQDDHDSGLTRTGQLLGTPGYMAPEQVDGLRWAVGPATDVHALGAILYESLTGRPPFKGGSLHETLALIREQEPAGPRRLRPGIPRNIETICLKCLEKDPAHRYASASDLADDLARFRGGLPIAARPTSRLEHAGRWCRRQPLLAALLAVCVLLGMAILGGAAWTASTLALARHEQALAEAETRAAREVAAAQEYYALLHDVMQGVARREPGWAAAGLANLQRAAALPTRVIDRRALRSLAADCLSGIDVQPTSTFPLPFGSSRIAFHPVRPLLAVGQAKGWLGCSVVLLDRGSGAVVRRLALPTTACWNNGRPAQDGVTALAFSPDGRWLVAGSRSGSLHRWDLSAPGASAASWPAHTARVNGLLFAPDGAALLSASDDRSVKRWSVAGGWKQAAALAAHGRLAIGPEPGSLLVTDHDKLHLVSRASLQPLRPALPVRAGLVASPHNATGPVLLAEGTSLCLLDGASGRVTQTLRNPCQESAHDGEIDDVAVSADGQLAASLSQRTCRVRLWELAGGRQLGDLAMRGSVAQIAFSPTGRELAVLGKREVRLHDLAGNDVCRTAALHAWPVLAFTGVGKAALACIAGDRPTCSGELTLWSPENRPLWRRPLSLPITRLPVRLHADADGTWLACTEADHLALVPVDRPGEPRTAPAGEMQALAFAPDGLLWRAGELKVSGLTVPDLEPAPTWDNTFSDILSGLGTLYAVAAGRQHVLVGGRDGALRLLDPSTGRLRENWKVCSTPILSVALSPDERLALVGTWKGTVRLLRLPSGEGIDLPGHHDRVEGVAFLADGLAATGSADRSVRLWRLEGEGASEWLSLQTGRPVRMLSASPDGRQVRVLLEGERGVRLLDVPRLREHLAKLGLE